MANPTEIARQAEHLDEAQWFEFLDEIDEVSRRRRQRPDAPDKPTGTTRDDVAAWLAQRHLLVDSAIREVWYLPDKAPIDEIRFLEVSDRMARNQDKITAIDFGLEIEAQSFHLHVADVTTDQLNRAKSDESLLPPEWTLNGNRVWRRGHD